MEINAEDLVNKIMIEKMQLELELHKTQLLVEVLKRKIEEHEERND